MNHKLLFQHDYPTRPLPAPKVPASGIFCWEDTAWENTPHNLDWWVDAEQVRGYEFNNRIVVFDTFRANGIRKPSGKKWQRWIDSRREILSRHPRTGRYMFLTCYNRGKGRESYQPWFDLAQFMGMQREYVQAKFGIEQPEDIFPLYKHFVSAESDTVVLTIPRAIRSMMQAPDLRVLTSELFGKTRYRKHLARAVAQSDLRTLSIARDFRGLVPIDWIVNFLVNSKNVARGTSAWALGDMRFLLRLMTPRSLRRLINDPLDDTAIHHICDTQMQARTWLRHDDTAAVVAELCAQDIRSWQDLHDRATRMANNAHDAQYAEHRLDGAFSKDIPQIPLAEALDGMTVCGLTLHTAKSTGEVNDWGRKTSCCIGGYAKQAFDKQILLGTLMDGEKIKALFEINMHGIEPKSDLSVGSSLILAQLLGPYNAVLSPNLALAFENAVTPHGVNCGHYWGKPQAAPV